MDEERKKAAEERKRAAEEKKAEERRRAAEEKAEERRRADEERRRKKDARRTRHDEAAPAPAASLHDPFAPLAFAPLADDSRDARHAFHLRQLDMPPHAHSPHAPPPGAYYGDTVSAATAPLSRMHLGSPTSSAPAPAGLHEFGLGGMVRPRPSPPRAAPGPIGPIERPRRQAPPGGDMRPEGVFGSAALGDDDELVEPRGRRPVANAAPSAGAFGAPGAPVAPPLYASPWNAPTYTSGLGGSLGSLGGNLGNGLGGLGGFSGSLSLGTAPPLGASALGSAPPPTLSGLGLGSPPAQPPPAPFTSTPWSSGWDRARHAFEQAGDAVFAPSEADSLASLSSPYRSSSGGPTATFPYAMPPAYSGSS